MSCHTHLTTGTDLSYLWLTVSSFHQLLFLVWSIGFRERYTDLVLVTRLPQTWIDCLLCVQSGGNISRILIRHPSLSLPIPRLTLWHFQPRLTSGWFLRRHQRHMPHMVSTDLIEPLLTQRRHSDNLMHLFRVCCCRRVEEHPVYLVCCDGCVRLVLVGLLCEEVGEVVHCYHI